MGMLLNEEFETLMMSLPFLLNNHALIAGAIRLLSSCLIFFLFERRYTNCDALVENILKVTNGFSYASNLILSIFELDVLR